LAVTGYRIYRGTSIDGETLLTTIGNVTSYTSTGLTNGQAYYFKVAAVNAAGTGANSTEASSTPAMVPGVPAGLTATPGNAQVVLNWTTPASTGGSPVTGYRIYRGTLAGSETLLITVGNVTAWTDTTTVNGQPYYYKVSAVNIIGEGMLSTEASATSTSPMDLTTITFVSLGIVGAVIVAMIIVAVTRRKAKSKRI
jgi:fibronectin type 3 domain-containing protein